MGYCRGDHLGQCLAHFIMGSAFIGYGIILVILLLVGQFWLRRTGRSQEFFDSLIIAVWGCVNTFTEHRWGGAWVGNDLQHTTMGIVWWCAGLVGIWLSRKRDGRPKRNLIPGIVILLTGWGMSAHPQELPLSTMVHAMFGYTLMLAGLTRIIEISFVLRDRSTLSSDGSDPNSFQHLPPFVSYPCPAPYMAVNSPSLQLLFASGFLFMGATEEQMAFLSAARVTHVSYILILYSIAFLLYLCKFFPAIQSLIRSSEHLPSPISVSRSQTVITHAQANSYAKSSTSSSTCTPSTPSPPPQNLRRQAPNIVAPPSPPAAVTADRPQGIRIISMWTRKPNHP